MRISDWSSDVCSSDLAPRGLDAAARSLAAGGRCGTAQMGPAGVGEQQLRRPGESFGHGVTGHVERVALRLAHLERVVDVPQERSEERRVGKEWVRSCRYRWLP